jgi:hypothetical protein
MINKPEDFRIDFFSDLIFLFPQLIILIAHNLRRLTYDSPHIKPLRKWMDEGAEVWVNCGHAIGKDTPINNELGLDLYMHKSKDVQLFKDLAPFALPPF